MMLSEQDIRETWAYIDGLDRLGTRLGLERIARLAEALGSPQKAYETIHIVGTNGKSSTTRFISALLTELGHRTGAYVSPHLVSLAERQMVDLVPSSDAEFCELVARVRPVVEELERSLPPGELLTQFEVLTAVAFVYFKEKGCDVAAIEAGLGGRLDATSIISSSVQVITSIGLEHTELLGPTTSAILREKAAVIPKEGRVIAGALDAPLKKELEEICRERQAQCWFLGKDFMVLPDSQGEFFDVLGLYDCYTDLRLEVLGGYQRANAAMAIAAVETFVGGALDQEAVRRGLASVKVPGRLEIVSTHPLCIFDGSHNTPGMQETMKSLANILERRRLIAVVSVLKDKDALGMMQALAPACDIIFATQSSSPRAIPADELAEIIARASEEVEVFVDPEPRSALMSAYRLATSNQVVLATGSFTLVGDLKRSLAAAGI
ncbi:MAG: bifunctional folylpolyglutamate synthase/dihydrofolate synthase [Thermoleophilia bacterium]|nr:bifunctional folylpolyglutamate synthase/dihydrofolate synthase [Thermoleophilia bacterium]